MRTLRSLALALALALTAASLPSTASAQEEVCHAYTNAQLRADMKRVDKALEEFDVNGAKQIMGDARSEIRCLDTLVDPTLLAEFARKMALIFFFDQDSETMRRWGLLSRYADPDLPWDDRQFPRDHPFRAQLEELDEPILGSPAGKVLAPPKKGGIFMNGNLVTRAEAPAEVPLLMQVADAKGNVIVGFWQDGARFPDQILAEGTTEPPPPKWWTGPVQTTGEAVAVTEPSPQPEPVVGKPPREKPVRTGSSGFPVTQVAISGGLLVGAGALAAVAGTQHARLDKATTEEELARIRTTTNALTVSAGVLAVGAIGVGTTIFFLDGGGGLQVRLHF